MHLRVALERLRDRFGVAVEIAPARRSATSETIRKPVRSAAGTRSSPAATASSATWCSRSSRCRAARASLSRKASSAARCRATISPSVEEGVVDGLLRGPLGFPVVDVQVTLTDGSYHSVDSSDMAFRTAARIGISEGLPQCQPVLLEPIHAGRDRLPDRRHREDQRHPVGPARPDPRLRHPRGLGRLGRGRAMMPEAEIGDLIVELRSATAGAGFYEARFDHLAEVTGRLARDVVAAHGGRGSSAA